MKIGEWDGRSKIDQERGCRKCYKRIVYHVVKGVTEIKPWPNRETSSGMTFI